MNVRKTYEALNGIELAAAIAKSTTRLALTIPGLNSRLTTFPRVQVEITIRVKAYDRAESMVTDMDEFIERLVEEGIDPVGAEPARDETYRVQIDETTSSADAIRRDSDLVVTKPVPLPDGRIVEVPEEANPLPAGDNLDNIVQFGAPGMPAPGTDTAYSGKGRVIDLANSGRLDVSQDTIRPKLKGDPAATHFRVR